MRTTLGMWKCECCDLSNPDEFGRCSYCGLPALHTYEELEKYKQVLSSIKNKDQNVWSSIFSAFITFIFSDIQFALILIIGLMAVVPLVKNHMLIAMPIAMLLVIFVWGYFYTKQK